MKSIAALFALIAVSGTASSQELSVRKLQNLDGGYSVKVPNDWNVRAGNSMPDFALYRVTASTGKLLLTIYVGNYPDRRVSPPLNANRSSTAIAGCSATNVRWTVEAGKRFGTTLIQIKHTGWPEYADFRFGNISNGEQELVEQVIQSFRGGAFPKCGR